MMAVTTAKQRTEAAALPTKGDGGDRGGQEVHFPPLKRRAWEAKWGDRGGTWSTGVVGTEVVANGANGRTALEARKRRSGVASV
jgi:hypothetical protein